MMDAWKHAVKVKHVRETTFSEEAEPVPEPGFYTQLARSLAEPVKTWNDRVMEVQLHERRDDAVEHQAKAGAELIRYKRRVEELEEQLFLARADLDRVARERDRSVSSGMKCQIELNEARSQLKIMQEDRDEYRNAIRACAPITGLLNGATKDEQAIALAFVRKLMGEGRTEHGALDLSTDKRTVEDLLREALDEALDSVSYVLMAQRKAGLMLGKTA